MDFTIIGTIKGMTNMGKGLSLRVRETKCGYVADNGNKYGEYDYTWNLVVINPSIIRFVKKSFRTGSFVKIKGFATQSMNYDDNEAILRSIGLRVDNIELFNFGDPKKEKMRERYNQRAIGDEKPNMDNYEDDF